MQRREADDAVERARVDNRQASVSQREHDIGCGPSDRRKMIETDGRRYAGRRSERRKEKARGFGQ
jgi:hypothetical protein